jgi:cysteinyl-tRNA synthetase
VRLGDLARNGAGDPRDRIAPVVDRVLELRVQMRTAGEYALADRLRDVLIEAGIEVRDTPEGSTWSLAAAATPA